MLTVPPPSPPSEFKTHKKWICTCCSLKPSGSMQQFLALLLDDWLLYFFVTLSQVSILVLTTVSDFWMGKLLGTVPLINYRMLHMIFLPAPSEWGTALMSGWEQPLDPTTTTNGLETRCSQGAQPFPHILFCKDLCTLQGLVQRHDLGWEIWRQHCKL